MINSGPTDEELIPLSSSGSYEAGSPFRSKRQKIAAAIAGLILLAGVITLIVLAATGQLSSSSHKLILTPSSTPTPAPPLERFKLFNALDNVTISVFVHFGLHNNTVVESLPYNSFVVANVTMLEDCATLSAVDAASGSMLALENDRFCSGELNDTSITAIAPVLRNGSAETSGSAQAQVYTLVVQPNPSPSACNVAGVALNNATTNVDIYINDAISQSNVSFEAQFAWPLGTFQSGDGTNSIAVAPIGQRSFAVSLNVTCYGPPLTLAAAVRRALWGTADSDPGAMSSGNSYVFLMSGNGTAAGTNVSLVPA